jgi:hypothetical protein
VRLLNVSFFSLFLFSLSLTPLAHSLSLSLSLARSPPLIPSLSFVIFAFVPHYCFITFAHKRAHLSLSLSLSLTCFGQGRVNRTVSGPSLPSSTYTHARTHTDTGSVAKHHYYCYCWGKHIFACAWVVKSNEKRVCLNPGMYWFFTIVAHPCCFLHWSFRGKVPIVCVSASVFSPTCTVLFQLRESQLAVMVFEYLLNAFYTCIHIYIYIYI